MRFRTFALFSEDDSAAAEDRLADELDLSNLSDDPFYDDAADDFSDDKR